MKVFLAIITLAIIPKTHANEMNIQSFHDAYFEEIIETKEIHYFV